MATVLKPGKGVYRVVPSKSHDTRKTGCMVAGIEHQGLGLISLRPKGTRHALSITVDALWLLLVKADVRARQLEKARRKKAKKAGEASK